MGAETIAYVATAVVGAYGARREGQKSRKESRRARDEAKTDLLETREKDLTQRRNLQRTALQSQPTMFDLLRGPGG